MIDAARRRNIEDSLARAVQALAVADAALGIGEDVRRLLRSEGLVGP